MVAGDQTISYQRPPRQVHEGGSVAGNRAKKYTTRGATKKTPGLSIRKKKKKIYKLLWIIIFHLWVDKCFSNKKSIIEALKLSDIEKMRNNNLDKDLNYDSLVKFRQFY